MRYTTCPTKLKYDGEKTKYPICNLNFLPKLAITTKETSIIDNNLPLSFFQKVVNQKASKQLICNLTLTRDWRNYALMKNAELEF